MFVSRLQMQTMIMFTKIWPLQEKWFLRVSGHQNTGHLDDVNCDARHHYIIGIHWAPALNPYQTGSYEIKCDERFTSCDSDVNPTSSEAWDAGSMSTITACTYTENVGVTEHFRGCQRDINIVHLIPTCTYEYHLHFGNDNSSELQLFKVWGIAKLFRYNEIRYHKEIYQSNSWDCCTTVSPLCEWHCWTFGLLVYLSENELIQFHGYDDDVFSRPNWLHA